MTRLTRACALAVLAIGLPATAGAQQCTTLGTPTMRRTEALRLVRMITSAEHPPRSPLVPGQRALTIPWANIESAPGIAGWKGDGGPVGDVARKAKWGTPEPLPGWQMHWLNDTGHYAFTLTDARDPCGFGYSSDDRGVILQGLNVDGAARVYPVETR